jgi:hypothetical protein
MFEFILQLLASAAVSAGLTTALIWLTKTWISERLKASIKSEYDQRLETHKAELKAQSDVELEKLRSQLTIAASEHEIRFSRLHEERAQVIAKTYSLLKELFSRLSEYVQIFEPLAGPSRQERCIAANNAHRDFHVYYTRKLIFFPKDVARKLEQIDADCVLVFGEFALHVELSPDPNRPIKWAEIFERVQTEIRAALSELEDHFRRLLGDET